MTSKEYWAKLVHKNNIPSVGTIKLDIEEFRRLIERAYNNGCSNHTEKIRAADDFKDIKKSSPLGAFGDMFGDIFK